MAKEKSTVELRDERAQLVQRRSEIIATGKKEERKLSEDENKELKEIAERCADIDASLAEMEARNRRGAQTAPPKKNFSLRAAMADLVSGREMSRATSAIHERGLEMHNACGYGAASDTRSLVVPVSVGDTEKRSTLLAGTPANGGELVQEENMELLLPLRDSLVLGRAGARIITGLTNNEKINAYSGTTVTWEEETAPAKDGAGTFTGRSFSPKRITAYVDISKRLLLQESNAVDALIRQDIADAVAAKLESTAFGKHASVTTIPDGLFTGATPDIKGAASWANVLKLEEGLRVQNAANGSVAYITHPSVASKFKGTVRADGIPYFISEGNTLNGYPLLTTTNMAKGLQTAADEYGIVFANWSDYMVMQWGALDLTYDPYTRATEGCIRFVINAYFDMGKRRDESFVLGSVK